MIGLLDRVVISDMAKDDLMENRLVYFFLGYSRADF